MPELPEVQSTVDYLLPRLKGRLIVNSQVLWSRTLVKHSPKSFHKHLKNAQISSVTRRGKFIVIWLSFVGSEAKAAILIHLRMSGCLEVVSQKIAADPYDRLLIQLDNKKDLRFNDVRKFGKVQLTFEPETVLARLGREPLDPDFTADILLQMLRGKRGAIKPLLLNQAFIAGIGNIYADECLWRSGIHPLAVADSIPHAKVLALHGSIRQVLNEAIALKGTDNGDEVVAGGMYDPAVYGKHGQSCLRCKKIIVKTVVGQRGTHFCPGCQRHASAKLRSTF